MSTQSDDQQANINMSEGWMVFHFANSVCFKKALQPKDGWPSTSVVKQQWIHAIAVA